MRQLILTTVVNYYGQRSYGILAFSLFDAHLFDAVYCIDYAKRSFYRAANGIFAKLGRLASEEVILELIMKKMYPSSALWSRGL